MARSAVGYALLLLLGLSLVACPSTNGNTPPMPQFDTLLVGTGSGIVKIDANTGETTELGAGGRWFDLHDGKIYSAKSDWTTVEVFDLDGNPLDTITHASSHAVGLVAVEDDLIALLDNEADKVRFIDMDGSLVRSVAFEGGPSSQNMDGTVVGNRLVVSENGKKQVFYVDLDHYIYRHDRRPLQHRCRLASRHRLLRW